MGKCELANVDVENQTRVSCKSNKHCKLQSDFFSFWNCDIWPLFKNKRKIIKQANP